MSELGCDSGIRVATCYDAADELLEVFERNEGAQGPRSIDAARAFFLPYTAENPQVGDPYVALFAPDAEPEGLLVGRCTEARTRRRIGPLRIPLPRLRRLELVYGGCRALGPAARTWLVSHLCELLERGDFDCIAVSQLPTDDPLCELLRAGLSRPGDAVEQRIPHWFAELLDADGEPLDKRSSRTLNRARRRDRELVKAYDSAVELRELGRTETLEEFIASAAAIGARSYQGAIGVGVQDDARWRTMLGIPARSGALRAFLLVAKGEPIAYAVGPVHAGTFSLLATAYLPEHAQRSPGTYLLRRVIERLRTEGIRWLDFGFGEAAYKERHGTLKREECNLHFFGRSAAARTARLLETGARAFEVHFRGWLERAGWLDRVRRAWRQRAQRAR